MVFIRLTMRACSSYSVVKSLSTQAWLTYIWYILVLAGPLTTISCPVQSPVIGHRWRSWHQTFSYITIWTKYVVSTLIRQVLLESALRLHVRILRARARLLLYVRVAVRRLPPRLWTRRRRSIPTTPCAVHQVILWENDWSLPLTLIAQSGVHATLLPVHQELEHWRR